MKFSFSNFSANILNYFWDISKNVILSIYFLFDSAIFFFFLFFAYIEALIFSFLSKNSETYFSQFFNFVVFFFNSRYSQINSFYLNFLNYLNVNQFTKLTSDVLIFVAFYSFFSVYMFTGSASVAFSNEGLWLSILSLAVIYFFFYLRTLENAGKDAVSLEIENLKKLMLKNSELSSEVVNLEDSAINFQAQVVNILESWFLLVSEFVEQMEQNSNVSSSQIETLLDSVFADHLKDLINLTLSRENLTNVILLKDFSEELVSEIFDSN